MKKQGERYRPVWMDTTVVSHKLMPILQQQHD